MVSSDEQHYKEIFDNTLQALKKYKKILFLTTSNRWGGEENSEKPKSTMLAYEIAKRLERSNITIIEVPFLNIYPCEGNVSTMRGNSCGELAAKKKDPLKNPSGHHRCWASINNKDDELWQIRKELFESDCVIFFGSVRWGQMNSIYQKLIERLTWIENRHTTLGEENIVQNIDAGIIIVSQNWNSAAVLDTQKRVLQYFGFNVINDLSWNWQYTDEDKDESQESYIDAAKKFAKIFLDSDIKI
jgi:multimeric flavodoxin WrbA